MKRAVLVLMAMGGMLTWVTPAIALSVTAGTVTAIESDTAVDSVVTLQFLDSSGDNVVYIVLDLGSTLSVDKILNLNRTVATTVHAKTASIWIASDESAGGFDPLLASNYTTSVFSGDLAGGGVAADLVATADITDSVRRYFLIKYTANFNGPLTGAANRDRVHVKDLQVVAPLPKGTTVIIK